MTQRLLFPALFSLSLPLVLAACAGDTELGPEEAFVDAPSKTLDAPTAAEADIAETESAFAKALRQPPRTHLREDGEPITSRTARATR